MSAYRDLGLSAVRCRNKCRIAPNKCRIAENKCRIAGDGSQQGHAVGLGWFGTL